MNLLFSPASLRILESLSFTDTLYAFDFDGTLAPIVKEPALAKMATSTERLFSRLTESLPIAVISGRSLSDMRERIPPSTQFLIGNHGLEGLPGAHAIEYLRQQCAEWKQSLQRTLEDDICDPGVILEDKEYSLAVHYRKSRQKKNARSQIVRAIELLEGSPRIVPGKLVLNVVPQHGPHKGIALSRVMKHVGAKFAFFIGDDCTDEDVFGMTDHRVLTVRVGNSSMSQAQYYIQHQRDIDRLLRLLLKFHGVSE